MTKVCKEGHKRIWYDHKKCPLCVAVEFGVKAQIRADRLMTENRLLKGAIARAKDDTCLACHMGAISDPRVSQVPHTCGK
jgi:hypothetical protein